MMGVSAKSWLRGAPFGRPLSAMRRVNRSSIIALPAKMLPRGFLSLRRRCAERLVVLSTTD